MQVTPSVEGAVNFFYVNELHFDGEFLGRMNLILAIAGIVSPFIYNRWFRDVPLKRILIAAQTFLVLLSFPMLLLITRTNVLLGIPDRVFAISDSFALRVVAAVASIPFYMLGARMSPKNLEGTMYSTFGAVIFLGVIVGGQLGAVVTSFIGVSENDFSSLWLLYIVSRSYMMIPLILLFFVNFESAVQLAEKTSEDVTTDGKSSLETPLVKSV
jgi:hypothetical protein